ncbi:S-layer family protein [cf. Phormidesmis sp. LEGE 11477]|uniref:two-partner secretion domain-containing protein n=1 Tax=cf. Phormidesmis sp. LEGE 11477 TaxID=1828680 RepID=UPI001880AB68
MTAQAPLVVSDETMPGENTDVDHLDNIYEIGGGAERGELLFHSFESFSIRSEEVAEFVTADNISTIFSRVTGEEFSDIKGKIRADEVDLFFINPAGVTFGSGSSIEIGGSVVFSTAESLVFAEDNSEFSSIDPQDAPMLTVSQPIGLSIGEKSKGITLEGAILDDGFNAGETVSLVGHGIEFRGGGIYVDSGQVELVSLAPGSRVDILPRQNTFFSPLGIDDSNFTNLELRDIRLLPGEEPEIPPSFIEVDTDSSEAGRVLLRGRQIELEGSQIFNRNFSDQLGGSISIIASEELTIDNSIISTDTYSAGDSGNISIEVNGASADLNIANASTISADTYSAGDSGNISIEVNGASADLNIANASIISADTYSAGDSSDISINIRRNLNIQGTSQLRSRSVNATGAAGTIKIHAENLSVQDGSIVSTSALVTSPALASNPDLGNAAGGILVIATPNGSIVLSGTTGNAGEMTGSSLFSRTLGERADEEQSNEAISINARKLSVLSGGRIDAGTDGSGDSQGISINATELVEVREEIDNLNRTRASAINTASDSVSTGDSGPLSIVTSRLEITDGGQVFTTTSGTGNGGDLIVEADKVVLSGSGTSPEEFSLFGLFARTRGRGDSGRLSVTTGSLEVRDGSRLTVSTPNPEEPLPPPEEPLLAENFGTVRDAFIRADSIVLDDGKITAESRSGDGGNLNLEVRDFILLRNNSLISATAGTDGSGGDGGNITIGNVDMPTRFIVTVPNEDNNIFANASSGSGGKINIAAQSILGFQNIIGLPSDGTANIEDIQENITNDIAAISEDGADGTVLINNLELNPTEGTVDLPTQTVTLGQVAQRCLADSAGNNAFVVTGQGGATPSPRDIIRNENLAASGVSGELGDANAAAIVEADGWHRASDGTVVFVAQVPQAAVADGSHYHSCIGQGVAQSLAESKE